MIKYNKVHTNRRTDTHIHHNTTTGAAVNHSNPHLEDVLLLLSTIVSGAQRVSK